MTSDSKSVLKCKDLGKVKKTKLIEFWERNDSREIFIEDLKKEVSLLKGDTLLIEVSDSGCDSKNFQGKGYLGK